MPSKFNPYSGDISITVSLLNTYLRDFYDSLSCLCEDLDFNEEELLAYLKKNNFTYDLNKNQIK